MPGKFKIVVSDLHLGAGYAMDGNRLEDFASEREFAALLRYVAAESEQRGAEVELIVNGDAFEMLQVPHVDHFEPGRVYAPKQYHSSSEADSVLKMAIVVEGHRPFFNALGRFLRASPPRRRATFVKGNHDLNLHWPGVQGYIRQATGATGARASLLAFEEWRIVREGIYVEHGNQYAELVDRVRDMEEPQDPKRPGQLETPLGSRLVMDVLNPVERDRYWVDGVKPVAALIWYALAFDSPFAVRVIATLIRALPELVSEGLLEMPEAGLGWAQELEDPDGLGLLAARYQADDAFRFRFNKKVADLLDSLPGLPPPDSAAYARSRDNLIDPVSMGNQVRDRTRSSLYQAASQRAAAEGVRLVTFGHTHDAGVEPLPNGAVYINSGTWTWHADFGGEGKETWRDLFTHPERFTNDRLLTYLRIDYDDAGQPAGKLLVHGSTPTPTEVQASLWEQLRSLRTKLWDWLHGLWRQANRES
jgi:UDP-2,3-diacylglucosamine pyrophosphatase LpxH